jgi:hypothetical protein
MLRLAIIGAILMGVSGCHQAVKAGPLTCSEAASSAGATVESNLFGVKTDQQNETLLRDFEKVWQSDFWQVYRAKGFAFEQCQMSVIEGVRAYPVVLYKGSYQFLLGSVVIKVTDNFDTQQLVKLGYPDNKPDRLNRMTLLVEGDLDQALADLQRLIGVEYVIANITKPIAVR